MPFQITDSIRKILNSGLKTRLTPREEGRVTSIINRSESIVTRDNQTKMKNGLRDGSMETNDGLMDMKGLRGLEPSHHYDVGEFMTHKRMNDIRAKSVYMTDEGRRLVEGVLSSINNDTTAKDLSREIQIIRHATDSIPYEQNSRLYDATANLFTNYTNKIIQPANERDIKLNTLEMLVEGKPLGEIGKERLDIFNSSTGINLNDSATMKKLTDRASEPQAEINFQVESNPAFTNDSFVSNARSGFWDRFREGPLRAAPRSKFTKEQLDFGAATFDRTFNPIFGEGKTNDGFGSDERKRFSYIFINGRSVEEKYGRITSRMSEKDAVNYMKAAVSAEAMSREALIECFPPKMLQTRNPDGTLKSEPVGEMGEPINVRPAVKEPPQKRGFFSFFSKRPPDKNKKYDELLTRSSDAERKKNRHRGMKDKVEETTESLMEKLGHDEKTQLNKLQNELNAKSQHQPRHYEDDDELSDDETEIFDHEEVRREEAEEQKRLDEEYKKAMEEQIGKNPALVDTAALDKAVKGFKNQAEEVFGGDEATASKKFNRLKEIYENEAVDKKLAAERKTLENQPFEQFTNGENCKFILGDEEASFHSADYELVKRFAMSGGVKLHQVGDRFLPDSRFIMKNGADAEMVGKDDGALEALTSVTGEHLKDMADARCRIEALNELKNNPDIRQRFIEDAKKAGVDFGGDKKALDKYINDSIAEQTRKLGTAKELAEKNIGQMEGLDKNEKLNGIDARLGFFDKDKELGNRFSYLNNKLVRRNPEGVARTESESKLFYKVSSYGEEMYNKNFGFMKDLCGEKEQFSQITIDGKDLVSLSGERGPMLEDRRNKEGDIIGKPDALREAWMKNAVVGALIDGKEVAVNINGKQTVVNPRTDELYSGGDRGIDPKNKNDFLDYRMRDEEKNIMEKLMQEDAKVPRRTDEERQWQKEENRRQKIEQFIRKEQIKIVQEQEKLPRTQWDKDDDDFFMKPEPLEYSEFLEDECGYKPSKSLGTDNEPKSRLLGSEKEKPSVKEKL